AMLKHGLAILFAAAAISTVPPHQDLGNIEQDWPFYGGDQGGTKFSPLVDINRETVARLAPAWEWTPGEKALPEFGTRPGAFEATPLMIDNDLYLTTPSNRVVALNANTGAELWALDLKADEDGWPPNR